jgi:transposase-like protein
MLSDHNQASDPQCELCGATMTFVESTPKVGAFPELLTFLCTECGDVRTVEKKDE